MSTRLSPAARPAAAAGFLPAALLLCHGTAARAAIVPQFEFAQGSADHRSSPGEDPRSAGVSVVSGAATSATYSDTITFPSGSGTGSTVAKAGVARRADANSFRVTFAPGTGVSQTDPGHARGPSSVQVNFEAVWSIQGGTLGPPILTSFSIPIGLKIGAGGSGGFSCAVFWEAATGDGSTVQARAPFVYNQSFGPGKYLTSITAPAAPFAFASLSGSPTMPSLVRMYGNIVLAADNEDAPSLVEIPTAENFGDLPDFPLYAYEAGMTTQDVPVPEPVGAGLFGLAGAGLLARRRRPARR